MSQALVRKTGDTLQDGFIVGKAAHNGWGLVKMRERSSRRSALTFLAVLCVPGILAGNTQATVGPGEAVENISRIESTVDADRIRIRLEGSAAVNFQPPAVHDGRTVVLRLPRRGISVGTERVGSLDGISVLRVYSDQESTKLEFVVDEPVERIHLLIFDTPPRAELLLKRLTRENGELPAPDSLASSADARRRGTLQELLPGVRAAGMTDLDEGHGTSTGGGKPMVESGPQQTRLVVWLGLLSVTAGIAWFVLTLRPAPRTAKGLPVSSRRRMAELNRAIRCEMARFEEPEISGSEQNSGWSREE